MLEVVAKLFYENGIRAVGIDRVAAEAGVTTTTLYRLFGSKDGLAVAYLEQADRLWFEWFERSAGSGAGGGAGQRAALEVLFDQLEEQANRADYRGCPFRMALAEYPNADSPIHQAASSNKRRTRQRFFDLAEEVGLPDPDVAADQLMVLVDGVCASATERSPDSPRGVTLRLVQQVLAARS